MSPLSCPIDQPPKASLNLKKVVLVCVLGMVALALLYQAYFFLHIVWYRYHNPTSSAFMRQTISELRREDPKASITHQWVDYDRISNNLKRAVIASEDANFFTHSGVEWEAIRDALAYNKTQAEKGSNRRRGGSTITQQLAKNLFLSEERSYARKAQELILSYMLESVLSKERILELYLNVAQWGNRSFGAQAAAHHYFSVQAHQLSPYQSARLAAMLPNPRYYDLHRSTQYLNSRTNSIQRRLNHVVLP